MALRVLLNERPDNPLGIQFLQILGKRMGTQRSLSALHRLMQKDLRMWLKNNQATDLYHQLTDHHVQYLLKYNLND